ncbi:hypothetical protein B9Z55_013842 [Caenorhabditis nigoni]|uniref:Uncharacterized protein n=1 Tax=Caenorhabditis nigoni TaxID=1611254 RepID=A0A2G5U3N2_9PELO|nr:hypothetical protein B9Z55_013842 [Caenorhabditis nigoni]
MYRIFRCPSLTHLRCSDGLTCIRKSWMCDGKIDCPDHSDEQHHICMKRNSVNKLQTQVINVGLKCPQPWFRCVDSSSCIAPQKVCDKYKDCRFGDCFFGSLQKNFFRGPVRIC